jgi:hypothetical protein
MAKINRTTEFDMLYTCTPKKIMQLIGPQKNFIWSDIPSNGVWFSSSTTFKLLPKIGFSAILNFLSGGCSLKSFHSYL